MFKLSAQFFVALVIFTALILISCYPGYEPPIALRAMGSNPNANTQNGS